MVTQIPSSFTDESFNQIRTGVNSAEIMQALSRIRARQQLYRVYQMYYDGLQPLTYQTDKYRNAFSRIVAKYHENMCPAVVDALADRLVINSFEVEGSDQNAQGAQLWDVWTNNNMDFHAGKVHLEAVKTGDAYAIVWPKEDPNNSSVNIFVQCADCMTVHYEEDSDVIDWAAKWWIQEDKRARLTLYYTDRIERYVSSGPVRSILPNSNVKYVPYSENQQAPIVVNPYDQVPVFHFANNALGDWGVSDLKDVLTVQDGLNKSVADLLVSMEFNAFPQRFATGLEMDIDPISGKAKPTFEPGMDRVWATENENVKFGEFSAANIAQFISVHDMFVTAVARVTGTPMHYMLLEGEAANVSGEALKTAEARFVNKVMDRQLAFGVVWNDLLTFTAKVLNINLTGRVSAMWKDANPRSDLDMAQVGVLKKQFGVSNEQIQREFGYSDEQIANMSTETAAAAQQALERNMALVNRGANPSNNNANNNMMNNNNSGGGQ